MLGLDESIHSTSTDSGRSFSCIWAILFCAAADSTAFWRRFSEAWRRFSFCFPSHNKEFHVKTTPLLQTESTGKNNKMALYTSYFSNLVLFIQVKLLGDVFWFDFFVVLFWHQKNGCCFSLIEAPSRFTQLIFQGTSLCQPWGHQSYCWWFRNLANQLRLVVYSIICRVM